MFSVSCEKEIDKSFAVRLREVPLLQAKLSEKLAGCERDTALLIKYLYGNMPISDGADYPFEVFLEYARHGVSLWKTGPYAGRVPEEIFLRDVVFHRINTEDISKCRVFFNEQLKNQVVGLSMEEAALKVNYWCAGEAAYQSTDDRTASPMTVYEAGFGRCGEESTFTVSALRSIGIPARQVYAHRWSHCDDNHAWVEVWCDGVWHFMGACEPEEILDRGWFTNSSSRAMMINTRIFGNQPADGPVVEKSDLTRAVSQLARYAKVTELKVQLVNTEGLPLPGVVIGFEVLNYAQLIPIARQETDEKGIVSLETGYGSLHLTATWQGTWTEAFVDVRAQKLCTLMMDPKADIIPQEKWIDFDMTAPVDAPVNSKQLTKEHKEIGARRLKAANQKRFSKMVAYPAEEEGAALHKSRGNASQIRGFLAGNEDQDIKEGMLKQLTLKDYLDCQEEVLREHLEYAKVWIGEYPAEIFEPYILNPRISRELLLKYRRDISEKFKDKADAFRKSPRQIWKWIEENIEARPKMEYGQLLTTPQGCLRLEIASFMSKSLLFVAICRTFGIPARLNPLNKVPEYYRKGEFCAVEKEAGKDGVLSIRSGDGTNWVYLQNWSIAQKIGTEYRTLNLIEGKQGDISFHTEPGEYRILSANRLPNGNQFAKAYYFSLAEGEEKVIELLLRAASLADMLENISLSDFVLYNEKGRAVKASDLTKGNENLLIWLEEGKEPTEHILNEMYERKNEFGNLAGQIIFIMNDESARENPTIKRSLKALPKVQSYYDPGFSNVNILGRRMYVDPDKLPLIIVTAPGLNGVYAASGYNVGTGDMLLRLLT